MQHIEFFHTEHFEKRYHRVAPAPGLAAFIDFYWETDFERLWPQYPAGFSDVLFPNTGYTYLINLGTPFIMQVDDKKFSMKADGFLPRNHAIECHHQAGNQLFGIKFRLSPVLYTTRVNFAEYRDYIFPLSYLLDRPVIEQLKQAPDFSSRVALLNAYFSSLTEAHKASREPVRVVSEIMQDYGQNGVFRKTVEEYARQYGISTRSLHRYFEAATGMSCKHALQVIRIRRALEQGARTPGAFVPQQYGYYDYSHFYKHLRRFLRKDTLASLQPHLQLLRRFHQS